MNIHQPFPAEAALLHLSSLQRREPRIESMADYDKAMAKFEKHRDTADVLRKWVDRDLSWSVPCGWLEDQIKSERAAAVECWVEARSIRAKLRRIVS